MFWSIKRLTLHNYVRCANMIEKTIRINISSLFNVLAQKKIWIRIEARLRCKQRKEKWNKYVWTLMYKRCIKQPALNELYGERENKEIINQISTVNETIATYRRCLCCKIIYLVTLAWQIVDTSRHLTRHVKACIESKWYQDSMLN